MFRTAQDILELIEEKRASIRCWKCLRLIQGESHECFQQAKRFVVNYHGDYRGSLGEFYSVYPLERYEEERLKQEGGELDGL